MTIYPHRPHSFTCAICLKHQDWSPDGVERIRWRYAAEYDIPPICRRCEKAWGKAIGGWGDLNRDRRTARQIIAIAEIMAVEAYRISHKKGALYGRA